MGRVPLTKLKKVRIKWAVITDKKYISGKGGAIAWTYDRKKAGEFAKMMGGRVIDVDDIVPIAKRAKMLRKRAKQRAAAARR